MLASDRAREAFRAQFGAEAEGLVFAPGRVNLIGEHVDYNDGLVLPMPLTQGTWVAWGPGVAGSGVEVHAADLDETDSFLLAGAGRGIAGSWQFYVRGMIELWPSAIAPLRLAIAGDLPRGCGLSSSASLCIAVGRALESASGIRLDAETMARLAQRVEHEFAGVACGIMDQMAIAAGKPDHALFLDCRDLGYRHIRFPDAWTFRIVQSGVTRGLVDGEYNARRQQCEQACEKLGVASLRDVNPEQLSAASLPEPAASRARHVVSEIERTRQAAEALDRGDIASFGALLNASHASLRDDFEVSHPVVDAIVERLQKEIGEGGGARMTGAGFGGAVVAVHRRDEAT